MSEATHITRINDELAAIARMSGLSHLIDSDAEIGAAKKIIRRGLEACRESDCGSDILKKSSDLLSKGAHRFQVNRLFEDLLAARCGGFTLMGRWINTRDLPVEMITPLGEEEFAALFVFHGGGRMGVATMPIEEVIWLYITAPLSDIEEEGTACIDPHHPDAFAAAARERTALMESVARFERVVGSMAGTGGNKGGAAGNWGLVNSQMTDFDRQRRGYSTKPSKQQDCANEMMTTRGLIDLLVRNGALLYHSLDPEKSFVSLKGGDHTSALVFERSAAGLFGWTVDSWVGDNGQPPEILPVEEWIATWSRRSGYR